jgi:fused signal recognition particle receptor
VGVAIARKRSKALPGETTRTPSTPAIEARPRDRLPPPGARPAEAAPPEEVPTTGPPEEDDDEQPPPLPPEAHISKPSTDEVQALREGLKTTRGGFIARLAHLFRGRSEIDPALLQEIEEVLLTADIGTKTTERILGSLREKLESNDLGDSDRVWTTIRDQARSILGTGGGGLRLGPTKPAVVLVVGVNGVGKTTTIGKLASRLKDEGKSVLLAAGDTFRAAAVLQLEVWGRRVGCEVVKGKDRADPGSVIFDAIQKAQEGDLDVVICDTAGRLHTKTPLMEEMKKIRRTIEKATGREPDATLLVLDATTGQNAVQHAQMFHEALGIGGICLTKLDGTAKGGVILGIVEQNGIPVRYVGIGERVEDLREFDPASFVEALFARPDELPAEPEEAFA